MILVVDDVEADRYTLSRILRSLGYKALEASDRLQANALIESEKVKAIFVDVFLGSDDGFAVARELSSRAALTVLISAKFRHSEDAHSAVTSGAQAFLEKPFSEAQIARILTDHDVKPSV